jgi:hypothetical protein
MRENTMIIKRTSLPKIRDAETSGTPSLDIKGSPEETINSLLLTICLNSMKGPSQKGT